MGNCGVKGKGGVTVRLEKGESVYIGNDIEVIVQKNNSPGSTQTNLRIIAPRDKRVIRSNYNGDKPNEVKK